MKTREVSREQWTDFFEDFSRRHIGWPSRVIVVGERLGAQVEAYGLGLLGVYYETGRNAITFLLEKNPSEHLEHPVRAPDRVWVEVAENGDEAALEIEALDGTKTILEFRPPAVTNDTRG